MKLLLVHGFNQTIYLLEKQNIIKEINIVIWFSEKKWTYFCFILCLFFVL